MWNIIGILVTALNTFVDTETLPSSPEIKKNIPALMSLLVQPTDTMTAAVPLLWLFNARSFDDLFYKMAVQVPPPPIYSQRVAVQHSSLQPRRDVQFPKNPAMERCAPPRDVLPSVPTVSTPVPQECRLQPTILESTPMPAVSTSRGVTSESLVPNAFTEEVPEPSDGKLSISGYGDLRSCHICDTWGTQKEMSVHMRSEGHLNERNRHLWSEHVCKACRIACNGYAAFVRHASTEDHIVKIVEIGGERWDFVECMEHFCL